MGRETIQLEFLSCMIPDMYLLSFLFVCAEDGTFLNPWSLACMDSVQTVLSHYGPQQLEDMVQGT